MSETHEPVQQNQSLNWPSILAAVGGILVILMLAIVSAIFFFSGLISAASAESIPGEPVILLSYSLAAILVSFLVLPVVVMAVRRLSGRPAVPQKISQRVPGFRNWNWLLLLYPVLVAAGYFLNSAQGLDLVLLPVINVLVLSLPVAWLVWLGTKNLQQIAQQRDWTVFGFSLTITPMVIVIFELVIALIGLILVSILAVMYFPGIVEWIEEVSGMLEAAANGFEISDDMLVDLVQSPVVVVVLLLFTAGLVPLIEESIKPLAVWLLGGRQLTPVDGWVLGLLSGAGFALIENLGNLAVGPGWTFLVLARAGAAGLHMFNSAIIGYTFVLSRQRKQWRPFILAFLGTIGLHALWNSVAVLATLRSITDPAANDLGWPLGYLAVMAAVSLAAFAGIEIVNRHLAGTGKIELIESEIN